MKNRIICSIFFIFSIAIFSQKITFSGTVKDSLQNPLTYANVLAKPKEISNKSQFTKNQQFALNSENKLGIFENHK